MPFIQSFTPPKKYDKKILFLSVDSKKIHSKSVDFARFQLEKNKNILWIDANLGISESEKIYVPLEKVLYDKAALPKAIRHSKRLDILSGKSSLPLSLCSEIRQKQFFLDLNILSENYHQIIVSSETIEKCLQTQWLEWAQKKFLFFSTENLFLEKTLSFLQQTPFKIDGLICLEKNQHQAYLTWLRLKKSIPNLPDLVLDITKTAQEP